MPKVSEIMKTDVSTISKEATVLDATKRITKASYGILIVVQDNKPIGIITETDIARNLIYKKAGPKEKVTKIMSSSVIAIELNSNLEKANKVIDTRHFRKYPVVRNGNLVGLVTEKDVVNSINDNIKFHRNVQNAVIVLFLLFELIIFIFYKYATMGF